MAIILPLSFATAGNSLNVWWPQDGAHLKGTQPFKAQVDGLSPDQYEMFWYVDGGIWNWMDTNNNDYPHKESAVDVSGWSWKGSGPYALTFVARQNGTIISQRTISIMIDNGAPLIAQAAPAALADTTVVLAQSAPPEVASPLAVKVSASVAPAAAVNLSQSNSWSSDSGAIKLYVDPNSSAAKQAKDWQNSNTSGASAMQVLASQPTASWFGGWNSDIYKDVHAVVSAAAEQNATPVLVSYNIPARDCGGYSSGGTNSPQGYSAWIQSFASAIGSNKAIVILEPDALAQLSCLSQADQQTRLNLLSQAVSTLKQNQNTKVYLDAGHSGWIDVATMASNLGKANIGTADGFALNVSNFDSTGNSLSYGSQISQAIGNKHFVVDTSRNGNGSDGQWCNPSGRGIGQKPTTSTGNPLVDAYLWVKTPGESDGSCNGGPSAGQWWPDYAVQLVTNAH